MKTLIFALTLILLIPGAGGAEVYQPHDHPAQIIKVITGTTRPRHTMMISAEVSGRLKSMPVDLGDQTQTQHQLDLDDTQVHLLIQQLEQELAIAQNQVRTSEVQGDQLVQHSQFLQKELLRSQTLLEQKGVSQQKIDSQQQELDQFKLDIEQQKLQQKVNGHRSQLLQIRLQQQKDWFKRHHIKLPNGWTVLERHKEMGEMVQVGEAILTLVDSRSQLVDLYLDPSEWSQLKGENLVFRYRHHEAQPKASLFHLSPIATQNRKQKATFWIQDAPTQSCGTEISLTLSQKDPEHMIIPENFSTQAYGQTLIQLEDGQTIPIFPMRKSDKGWVVSLSSLNPEVKIVIPHQKK